MFTEFLPFRKSGPEKLRGYAAILGRIEPSAGVPHDPVEVRHKSQRRLALVAEIDGKGCPLHGEGQQANRWIWPEILEHGQRRSLAGHYNRLHKLDRCLARRSGRKYALILVEAV